MARANQQDRQCRFDTGVIGGAVVAVGGGAMAEHLAANGVDLEKTKVTFGVALKMDPQKEQFLGRPEANKLLTRDYRKPFVVPEKV